MNLLEYLAQETGCVYLSDLHKQDIQAKLLSALSTVAASDYPLQEWQEALAYIAGLREDYTSCEQAYQALTAYAKHTLKSSNG